MKNTTSFDLTATSSYATLQKAMEGICEHRSRQGNLGLTFSIFETSKTLDKGLDSGDWIVDHPDIWSEEPVFQGDCVFLTDYWRVSDKEVYSAVMRDPTWAEIINECNRQLIDPEDGSTAQLFLEGFYELEPKDGCRVFDICWGS
jgi:hypothetical protein